MYLQCIFKQGGILSFKWNGHDSTINISSPSAHTPVSIVYGIRTCRFLPLSIGCNPLIQTIPVWPFTKFSPRHTHHPHTHWMHVRVFSWSQKVGRSGSSPDCSGMIIHVWAQKHSHGLGFCCCFKFNLNLFFPSPLIPSIPPPPIHDLGFSPHHSLPQHHPTISLGSQRDTLPSNEPPSQIRHHHPHSWDDLQHIRGLSDSCPRHTVLPHG